MGSIFARGTRLYIRFKGFDGSWAQAATENVVGEEAAALAVLDRTEAKIAAGAEHSDPLTGRVTVERFYERWVKSREEMGVASWRDDRGRMRKHVLPVLGRLDIEKVRPRHIVDLVKRLRKSGALALKTVHNVYGCLAAFFRDAQLEDLISQTPCILTEHQLGVLADRDVMEGAATLYSRGDIRTLISDPRIARDRQQLYALEFFGRLRLGECLALRWRHLKNAEPLDSLEVIRSHGADTTKSRRRRYVPVHPTLAAMLAEWRLQWASLYDHQPGPEDLVVPVLATQGKGKRLPTGARRTKGSERQDFADDLARVGIAHRRRHDLGATFITLAENDGADPDRLAAVTHTAKRKNRGAFDSYLRPDWPRFCAEVAKLQLSREIPAVQPLAAGLLHRGDLEAQPVGATQFETWRRRESNPVHEHRRHAVVVGGDVFPAGWVAAEARRRLRAAASCSNAAKPKRGIGGRDRAVSVSIPRPSERGGGR